MTPEQQRVEDFGKAIGWQRKLNCWLDEDREVIADAGWNPFNNVHDAMIAFQELRESGFWCCLNISCDYAYATYIELTPSYFAQKKYGIDLDEHKPVIRVQECDCEISDMAELICRAVLEAKKYEETVKSRPVNDK